MSTRKKVWVPQAVNSDTTGDTNASQRLAMFKDNDDRREQWQIADIQTGLKEADLGEFASLEGLRVMYAKYGR